MVHEEEKELINAHELARALDLSVDTIWRYTRENKIPFLRLGGKQYRYRLPDVVAVLSDEERRYGQTGITAEQQAEYGITSDRISYQDYLKLPAEMGYSYEVLDGILIKDPSPDVSHQRIIPRLWLVLDRYFKTLDPGGEVFIAPLDVTLGQHTVIQPDLFYVSGRRSEIIHNERIDGAPDLIVEVISKYGTGKDRIRKKKIYQEAGIQHYWMVDPAEKTLECYTLRDSLYSFIAGGTGQETIKHPEFSGLELELVKLWGR